jgi:hypothetical protein
MIMNTILSFRKRRRGVLRFVLTAPVALLLAACQTATVSPVPDRTAVPEAPEQSVLASLEGARVGASIAVTALDRQQAPAAGLIQQSLASAVVASGYILEDAPAAADLALHASYKADLFDQSGNYFLYDGTASARIVRKVDGKVLAQTRLEERGPRALEERRALEANAQRVSDALIAWLDREMNPAAVGIVASDVTISRPTFYRRDYPSTFIEKVGAVPGVTAVRFVGEDSGGNFIFRVIYFPEEIPEGLLARLRSIRTLNIR